MYYLLLLFLSIWIWYFNDLYWWIISCWQDINNQVSKLTGELAKITSEKDLILEQKEKNEDISQKKVWNICNGIYLLIFMTSIEYHYVC